MRPDPLTMSARELSGMVRNGDTSAQEVTQFMLDRIASVNPAINAIVQDCAETALADAVEVDRKIAAGEDPGIMAGVPVTIKVIADQVGYATTNGTTLAKDLVAQSDSPFLAKLKDAGGIVVGRTNTPAFSYRWFTSNRMHGQTLNPRNPALTPGGSSGGAGAAVAAGLGHIAHGTDIAGSIRYPAYACGVQGLRPTPGRVPQFNGTSGDRGIGPQMMAVSGPLARRVDDLRFALEVMSGYDINDPGSAPVPLIGSTYQRRAALVRNPSGLETDPRIDADLDRAAAALRAAGGEVVEPTDVPDLREAVDIQVDLWIGDDYEGKLAAAEAEGDPGALACLHRFRDRAGRVDAKRIWSLFQRRSGLSRAWRAFAADYPVILMPNSAELPFKADEDLEGPEVLDRLWGAQLPQIALPVVGLPGASVWSGTEGDVPCGVQVISAPWREDICLDASEVLERAFGVPDVAD